MPRTASHQASLPLTALSLASPQRCEHQAGSPLRTLAEAPLSHCGLEDFAAALATHCRRVKQVYLAGNVVGRLERAAMGKLKVRRRKRGAETERGRRAGWLLDLAGAPPFVHPAHTLTLHLTLSHLFSSGPRVPEPGPE